MMGSSSRGWKYMVYIGVDPGTSGGLAAISVTTAGNITVTAVRMPSTEKDIWNWVREQALSPARKVTAVIEKVSGYIGKPTTGKQMFNFGWSYGGLRMALVAAGVYPFEEVTPQRWQKTLGITPRDNKGGETRTSFKNRLKAKAKQLFPQENVTLGTADALLIAEYGRRTQTGTF